MRVKVAEVEVLMADALKKKGYADADIPFIVEMYLGGELSGHKTHGLAAFPQFVQRDFSGLPASEVIKNTNALYMVDAHGNSGNVLGKHAADEAIKRAKAEGAGTAMVKNMDDMLRPGALAKYIAEQGFIGIVMQRTAANIAPPGGYDPVVGTNPLAYGIPTSDEPLVVDMAMSKMAFGNVRLAKKHGQNLPENTFYTDKGEVAVNPEDAHSVMPAGEHKGFALALLIEILCGSALGMPTMVISDAQKSYGNKLPERGLCILVFDPAQTSGGDIFAAENSGLLAKIKATRALSGQTIRIPGESAQQGLHAVELEIPEEIWQEIKSL